MFENKAANAVAAFERGGHEELRGYLRICRERGYEPTKDQLAEAGLPEVIARVALSAFEQRKPTQVWLHAEGARRYCGERYADFALAQAFAQQAVSYKQSGDTRSIRRLYDGAHNFVLWRQMVRQAFVDAGLGIPKKHKDIPQAVPAEPVRILIGSRIK